jgi:hypothetical protein
MDCKKCGAIDRDKLMSAANRLLSAALDFEADQSGAPCSLIGLVQPVTVEQCKELSAAIAEIVEVLSGEK